MTPFFEQLGKMTNNKYNFLRLKEALLDKEHLSITLNFVIPKEISKEEWNQETMAEVENFTKDILPSGFTIEYKYSRSVLDEDIFIKVINDYIKNTSKALIGQYDKDNIEVYINNDKVKVVIYAYDIAIQFVTETGLLDKLTNHLNNSFCAEVKVELKSLGKPQTHLIKHNDEPVYIDKGIIYVKNRQAFFGGEGLLNPKYICNYKGPVTEGAICGRLQNFERHRSKKNDRIYYTFSLNDSTGEMNCLAFSRSTKKGAFDWLMDTSDFMATFGKSKKDLPCEHADIDPCLVVEGEIIEDTYKKGLAMIVRKAAYCQIDFDEVTDNRTKNFIMRKKSHRAVPVPYAGSGASDLFDLVEEPCSYITNNKFVVFDLETTGLDTTKARIIELGAVKIEKGEITSYYNSLVDPKMPIPEDASKVNQIFDKDVVDAPYIEDCLKDFMEYCKDCILVAHNGDFYDFKILRRDCYENNFEMDNKLVDSLVLSRKAFPEFPNHKLGTLCSKLNVQLTNAHRAYFDAEATAKVFIKMCNKLNMK